LRKCEDFEHFAVLVIGFEPIRNFHSAYITSYSSCYAERFHVLVRPISVALYLDNTTFSAHFRVFENSGMTGTVLSFSPPT